MTDRTTEPETDAPEDPDPDLITVRLANPQRTSAGDCPPDRVVKLPADEARELLRQELAVRLP